jgi:hypothetical protein
VLGLAAHAATVTPATAPAAQAPAVEPVPGTDAALAAADHAAAERAHGPHILRQPDGVEPPKGAPRGLPKGMQPQEVADRIAAALLAGTGPILLLVPGTLGTEYQTSMLALGRAALKMPPGELPSIASIPYDNGIADIATRYFGKGGKPDMNVLSLVLHRLQRVAGSRPILLAGESQGAWLIADTLRTEPELAKLVTRVAMFANPGFAKVPATIGGGTGQPAAATGIVQWRHIDDVVPNLFAGVFTKPVLGGFEQAFQGLFATGHYHYTPHHYDRYAPSAAQWLLEGIRPKVTQLASTDPLPAA